MQQIMIRVRIMDDRKDSSRPWFNNNFIMLSEAGRQYERSKRIKPFEKSQRERIYKSTSVKVEKHTGLKKFSPFNTVDRTSRDSYLLRVTNEPNTDTNYQPKNDFTLPLERRSTIDQAKFKRIIGEVKQDYSITIDSPPSKCLKSLQVTSRRPLTVRETHNWRKTMENFDFSKQQDSKRLSLPRKLSVEESTSDNFMNNLQTITQSNFNNFKRFSFKARVQKAHPFDSDSGHQYLREVEEREKSPEYDIQASNEAYVHRSMPNTKGEKRFSLFRQKITTRQDRADKNWHTYLEYNSQRNRLNQTIGFQQLTDRKPNEVHSKYPIRLSLSRPLKVCD